MKLSSSEAAYIAGFIDGEGSLQIMKRFHKPNYYPSYTAYIDIGNTHKGVLEWINQATGNKTKIHTRNTNTRSWWGNRKEAYFTRFNLKLSKELVEEILPYLIIKKRQAEIFLELPSPRLATRTMDQEIRSQYEVKREALYQEIKKLNQRGNSQSAETLQKTS